MSKGLVDANGLKIFHETFGDPGNEPMILVMGYTMQMIGWEDGFCNRLAGEGFHVIRFDNRDVGLSSKIEEGGELDMMDLVQATLSGKRIDAPYLVRDMAEDAIGLLDALGIQAAHAVGASMGGMIAQSMAINHPSRIASLASIMSSPAGLARHAPSGDAARVLATPVPPERQAFIEQRVKMWKALHGDGFPFDGDLVRKRARRAHDRSDYTAGMARQLAAILASPSREEGLQHLDIPSVVIHGDADPLMKVDYGKETAELIPGSELVIIEGMGHELPPGAWPRLVDAIATNARKAPME